MKKAIALTLALSMASSMSAIVLAGDAPIAPNTYAPGSEISIVAVKFADKDGNHPTDELNRNNFTVSVDWNKGGAMVDTVKIDNNDKEVQILHTTKPGQINTLGGIKTYWIGMALCVESAVLGEGGKHLSTLE